MQIDDFDQTQDATGRGKAPLLPVAKRGYWGSNARGVFCLPLKGGGPNDGAHGAGVRDFRTCTEFAVIGLT